MKIWNKVSSWNSGCRRQLDEGVGHMWRDKNQVLASFRQDTMRVLDHGTGSVQGGDSRTNSDVGDIQ